MKTGTTVRIKKEWRDPSESENTLYIVIEDNGDRSVIRLKDCDMPLKPSQTVMDYMLEEA